MKIVGEISEVPNLGEISEEGTKYPGRYCGVVKSYNDRKRFGFIACPYFQKKYNADVFLSHMEKFNIKDKVSGEEKLFKFGHANPSGIAEIHCKPRSTVYTVRA